MNRPTVLLKIFVFLLFFLSLSSFVSAEELKVVFTGQAHAALYPCSCPLDRWGGLSRRASAIRQIRSGSKNVLVLEAGGSCASGEKDEFKQDVKMDRLRMDIYFDSLKKMDYDALLAGSQEFSFDADVIKKHRGLSFVVSNIEGFKPAFAIKDFGWLKVGIIGVSDVIAQESKGLKWISPSAILRETIVKLKHQKVDFIILLSDLNPGEDEELLKKCAGIDLVINGSYSLESVTLQEFAGTVMYLKTWWQARSIGVLSLDFKDKVLQGKNLETIKLGQEIVDDKEILSILPACFADADCPAVQGSAAQCRDGGFKKARCVYTPLEVVNLTIIVPRACRTCRADGVIANINKFFPNLQTGYLFEDHRDARVLMDEFRIKMLPAYVFGRDILQLQQFEAIKPFLLEGKDHYLLKPSDSGVSYLLNRKDLPKRLDVFFDFSYPQAPALFELLRDFEEKHKDYEIRLNFLVIRDKKGKPMSRGGEVEIEEFRRLACIDKFCRNNLFNYLTCRSSQKGLSWWGECALKFNIDTLQIKECAASTAGRLDFDARVALAEELEIITGPTFIIDNKEIFSIVNVPALEEFEKTVIGEAQADEKEK